MNGAPYQPKPGSVAYRTIAWLEQQPVGADFLISKLAEAVNHPASSMQAILEPALQAERILKRAPKGQARPFFFSLNPLHHPEYRDDPPPAPRSTAVERRLVDEILATETPQGNQPRSERGREGMEAAACESAAERGADGAPALATLPPSESPGVGPMGAGQAADAAPAGDDYAWVRVKGLPERRARPKDPTPLRCALWSDGSLEILRTAEQREPIILTREETRALVAYLDAISLDGIA